MKCHFCHESFLDSFSREDHEKIIHHKIKIYQCKICHEKKRGINSFDKHLTFTHGTSHWQINLGLRQTTRLLRNML
jgi:ABC-type iron transport system FetAB ATPase subunit